MKRFRNIVPLVIAGMMAFSGIEVHAQTRSISECTQKLTTRGFNVIEKDIDDNLYEFEAIKNNQKWDVKMDRQCNVLLERIDD